MVLKFFNENIAIINIKNMKTLYNTPLLAINEKNNSAYDIFCLSLSDISEFAKVYKFI